MPAIILLLQHSQHYRCAFQFKYHHPLGPPNLARSSVTQDLHMAHIVCSSTGAANFPQADRTLVTAQLTKSTSSRLRQLPWHMHASGFLLMSLQRPATVSQIHASWLYRWALSQSTPQLYISCGRVQWDSSLGLLTRKCTAINQSHGWCRVARTQHDRRSTVGKNLKSEVHFNISTKSFISLTFNLHRLLIEITSKIFIFSLQSHDFGSMKTKTSPF